MKTILFLLLSASLSAQLSTTPKVIYRAIKADTVTAAFSPNGSATLSVFVDNEAIDDKVQLTGYHVLQFVLDSGAVVTASATGIIGHTIYRNGISVTPALVADNSFTEFLNWYNGLTAAQQRRVNVYALWKQHYSIKDLKKSQ